MGASQRQWRPDTIGCSTRVPAGISHYGDVTAAAYCNGTRDLMGTAQALSQSRKLPLPKRCALVEVSITIRSVTSFRPRLTWPSGPVKTGPESLMPTTALSLRFPGSGS